MPTEELNEETAEQPVAETIEEAAEQPVAETIEETTEAAKVPLQTPEETEAPNRAPQETEEMVPSNASSRAIVGIIALIAVVGIAVALAFAMGLFSSSSPEPASTNAATSSNGMPEGTTDSNGMPEGASTTAEEAAAKLAGYGGDAGRPWAQSGVQRPSEDPERVSGAGGIVGTWVCRDYDFDGKTFSFQATFSDTGTFAVWLYNVEADVEAHFAGLRNYHAEGDQVVEDGGFVFTAESADTITLHVSEENQPHQQKTSYTFTRKTDEAETLKQLSWTSGDWYAQDETGENYFFGMNGYWYNGDDETSSGCWYILDNDVILEGDPAAGTTTTTLKFMGATYDVLVHVDNERIYGWNPPGEE